MSQWCFNGEEGQITLCVDGNEKGTVKKVTAGEVYFLQILTVLGSFSLNIGEFICEKGVSKKFEKAVRIRSRTLFVTTWKNLVKDSSSSSESAFGDLSTDSASESDSFIPGSVIKNPARVPGMATKNLARGLGSATKTPDRSPSDNDIHSDDDRVPQTSADLINLAVKQKCIGDCVDVHLDNLFGPPQEFITRQLDYEHVAVLEKSFLEHPGQKKLLVGNVTEDVPPEKLRMAGAAQVQVLGGNHTRMALQNLQKKGLLDTPTVKMVVYAGLNSKEALSTGVFDNDVEVIHRAFSFIEKTKLIRSLLPSTKTKQSNEDFKRTLMCIFGLKTLRQVSHNMKNHLKLARVSEELWKLVIDIDAAWRSGTIKHSVKEKDIGQTMFVKMFKYVAEDVEKIKCLTVLLKEGVTAFRKQVMSYVKQQEKESQMLSRSEELERIDETDDEDEVISRSTGEQHPISTENTELGILRKRCEELEAENSALKLEVERLKEECERRASISVVNNEKKTKKTPQTQGRPRRKADTVIEYSKGENVSALWIDNCGRNWYDAVISKIMPNGEITVTFYDGFVKTLKPSYIRKLTL